VRAILLAGRLLYTSLSEAVRTKPINPYGQVFTRYLKYALGSRRDEHLRIFFLNDAMTILAEDEHTGRSPTHVTVSIRHLIARALELGATSLILAHNHPSGRATPSAQDIEFTRRITETGAAVGVRLIDHFIIAHMSVRSIIQGRAV
jgi:DNA repair protein RadC